MMRVFASLVAVLLVLAPTLERVCDVGCPSGPDHLAEAMTGRSECNHGEDAPAPSRVEGADCDLDVAPIVAVQAAAPHVLLAPGAPLGGAAIADAPVRAFASMISPVIASARSHSVLRV